MGNISEHTENRLPWCHVATLHELIQLLKVECWRRGADWCRLATGYNCCRCCCSCLALLQPTFVARCGGNRLGYYNRVERRGWATDRASSLLITYTVRRWTATIEIMPMARMARHHTTKWRTNSSVHTMHRQKNYAMQQQWRLTTGHSALRQFGFGSNITRYSATKK